MKKYRFLICWPTFDWLHYRNSNFNKKKNVPICTGINSPASNDTATDEIVFYDNTDDSHRIRTWRMSIRNEKRNVGYLSCF